MKAWRYLIASRTFTHFFSFFFLKSHFFVICAQRWGVDGNIDAQFLRNYLNQLMCPLT